MESTASADAGTSTAAASRRGSKLVWELRPGALRGERERLRLLAGAARHCPAHVAVAENEGGEERRERRPDGPARMCGQEAPDGAGGRREEVPVPEQRPDARAESEGEDVRQPEEDHSPPARAGGHVLFCLRHGRGA